MASSFRAAAFAASRAVAIHILQSVIPVEICRKGSRSAACGRRGGAR